MTSCLLPQRSSHSLPASLRGSLFAHLQACVFVGLNVYVSGHNTAHIALHAPRSVCVQVFLFRDAVIPYRHIASHTFSHVPSGVPLKAYVSSLNGFHHRRIPSGQSFIAPSGM